MRIFRARHFANFRAKKIATFNRIILCVFSGHISIISDFFGSRFVQMSFISLPHYVQSHTGCMCTQKPLTNHFRKNRKIYCDYILRIFGMTNFANFIRKTVRRECGQVMFLKILLLPYFICGFWTL